MTKRTPRATPIPIPAFAPVVRLFPLRLLVGRGEYMVTVAWGVGSPSVDVSDVVLLVPVDVVYGFGVPVIVIVVVVVPVSISIVVVVGYVVSVVDEDSSLSVVVVWFSVLVLVLAVSAGTA
jgi:hypothetical protein